MVRFEMNNRFPVISDFVCTGNDVMPIYLFIFSIGAQLKSDDWFWKPNPDFLLVFQYSFVRCESSICIDFMQYNYTENDHIEYRIMRCARDS